jgi:hypothetical protein
MAATKVLMPVYKNPFYLKSQPERVVIGHGHICAALVLELPPQVAHLHLERQDLAPLALQAGAVAGIRRGCRRIAHLLAQLGERRVGGHVAHPLPAAEARDVLVQQLLDAGVAPVGERAEGDLLLQHGRLVPGAVREQAGGRDARGKVVALEVEAHLVVGVHNPGLDQSLQGGCHARRVWYDTKVAVASSAIAPIHLYPLVPPNRTRIDAPPGPTLQLQPVAPARRSIPS